MWALIVLFEITIYIFFLSRLYDWWTFVFAVW